MKRILVLGSLNIDLVQNVPRLPVCGETLTGSDLQLFAGGKGANQACAAAKLGGEVRMAGRVGADPFGERLLNELRASGADVAGVQSTESATGSATIFVLPHGDNVIVIGPGANGHVTPDFAVAAVNSLEAGDFLLCQLEIPLPAVEAALHTARQRGATTILDPAPGRVLPSRLLQDVSILTPNQTEAALLLGDPEPPAEHAAAQQCAARLVAMGPERVIVKLGERGCVLATSTDPPQHIPTFAVSVIDTTAAGDTFNGALAAALSVGQSLADAARFANAAAALSVTKAGAIPSIPSRAQVDAFLASSSHTRTN